MSDPFQMVYTVGVQRWPLPLYKRFKVIGHETVEQGGLVRLMLTALDGSFWAIPALHRRRVRVYPDYKAEKLRIDVLKAHLADKEPAVYTQPG